MASEKRTKLMEALVECLEEAPEELLLNLGEALEDYTTTYKRTMSRCSPLLRGFFEAIEEGTTMAMLDLNEED